MERRTIKPYVKKYKQVKLTSYSKPNKPSKHNNMSKSKKSFTRGLGSLLGEKTSKITPEGAKKFLDTMNKEIDKPKKVGRPTTQFKEITKSSQQGTKEGETRATFIVNEELLDKLKAIAYWDRELLKETINKALLEYVSKKKIKPRPEEILKKEQESNQKLIRDNKIARLPKY
jgi:hypothetical protein